MGAQASFQKIGMYQFKDFKWTHGQIVKSHTDTGGEKFCQQN